MNMEDFSLVVALQLSPIPLCLLRPLHAEMALSLQRNLGLTDIVLESDCLPLINACKRRKTIAEISVVIEDISKLQRGFNYCQFSWVPRAANKVAHQVAHMFFHGKL